MNYFQLAAMIAGLAASVVEAIDPKSTQTGPGSPVEKVLTEAAAALKEISTAGAAAITSGGVEALRTKKLW